MVQKLFFLLFLWLTTYSNTQAQLPTGSNLLGVRLDWHPLGEMIAAADHSSVHLYNADGVQIIRSLPSFPNLVTDVAWNPDGTKLAVANGYEIQIWQEPWNVNALQPELIIQSPMVSNDLGIVSVDWHPSAEKILGVNTPNAYIWDTTTGQIIETITPQQNAILSASWNNNGEQLGRGDIVGGVVIDNLATDTREFSAFFDRSGVYALSWSPAGDKVAAGSGSGILQIFSFSPFFTGNGYIETETEKIISLAWNPTDDNLVASGSTDGSVAVWDVQTKQTVVDLQAGSAVPSVDWSADGQKLAYGFEGGFDVVELPSPLALTSSEIPTLLEMLSAPSCSIACFLGIEPGVTTKSEMEAILNERGIAFESYPIGRSGYITSYRLSINNVSPFIPKSTGIPASAGVMLGADIVEQIDISLINVSVSDVLAAYGAPEVVGKTGAFVLVYPSRGLVFFISRTDPTVVDLVYIRTQVSTQGVFGDVAPCVAQPIICNIQTATAVPTDNITPTATATATATPTVSLRSIFNPPSCAVACWLGIEPGVTTQADLENILSGLNIEYEISLIGLEGNTFDYSFNPNNEWPYVGNNQRSIGILVGDGIVFQMIVPLADVPIDTILGQYGSPDGIVGPAENRLLIYASYGLAFFVSRTDSTVVTSAWFSTPTGIVYAFVDNPNYPVIQPCTQPANLCAIETATP